MVEGENEAKNTHPASPAEKEILIFMEGVDYVQIPSFNPQSFLSGRRIDLTLL